ncbi:TPA: DUF4145 domain-containing protein [Enterococcus faecalis]|nr:DUF4145 domain-containing protein [Enterococcus faecalis]EKI2465120.1 DUF4145 domain-containing protein [Enterococcus faecalis]PQB64967.1 hypothetical protein CUN12_08905 [Enterococcus faecalis]HAP3818006.1 DUF4145 domain-containing protein [Enterococcus faecalis]HAP3877491.1 DUF4145 domain-containing protein [Enterococcus faecalis]
MASKLFKNQINTVALFLKCSISECNKFHIQEFPFKKLEAGTSTITEVGSKIPYTYRVKLENTLPAVVNNTFPEFKDIYEQSLEAESQGLNKIAGVGFRKSIEFLIKEYVIHKDPDSSEQVKSKFLGKVINENLSEFPKIQTLAKAAVWIGNDETHFVRVHDDKDIQDMKEFLTAAALFISAELKVEEALEFTNRPKE